MDSQEDQIQGLYQKIEDLLMKQGSLSREIYLLREEVNRLKSLASTEIQPLEEIKASPAPGMDVLSQTPSPKPFPMEKESGGEFQEEGIPVVNKPPTPKSDLEKFIGENLINKIGMAVTVIGVGIGVKYSIDHQLISPLTRIILGYLMGIGLMGFALWLKKNYEIFSAVLLSGSMAILYFITFSSQFKISLACLP